MSSTGYSCDVCGHAIGSMNTGPTCSQCTAWAADQEFRSTGPAVELRAVKARMEWAEKHLEDFKGMDMRGSFARAALYELEDLYMGTQTTHYQWSHKRPQDGELEIASRRVASKYAPDRFQRISKKLLEYLSL